MSNMLAELRSFDLLDSDGRFSHPRMWGLEIGVVKGELSALIVLCFGTAQPVNIFFGKYLRFGCSSSGLIVLSEELSSKPPER